MKTLVSASPTLPALPSNPAQHGHLTKQHHLVPRASPHDQTKDGFFDFVRYSHQDNNRTDGQGDPPSIEPIAGQPRTSVDTLRLLYPFQLSRVPDFHVLTRRDVKHARFGEHPLWNEEDGTRRWGIMAVRRAGPFRFRIAPLRPGGTPMLRAFFSAPHAFHGHNGLPVTQTDLIKVLQGMEETLAGLGVEIDWTVGQVGRLDVCRDVLLPRPFHYYRSVLRLIWPRYNRLHQNYPSGIVRGTATKCVWTQYDKRTERQRREQDAEGDGGEAPFSTWLRTECRLPTAAAVRERTGIETVAEMVARYDELSPWLDRRIETDFLPDEVPPFIAFPCEPRDTIAPDEEIWWQLQLQGHSNGLKDRLALFGLRVMLENMAPKKSESDVWEMLRSFCTDGEDSNSPLRADLRRVSLNGYSDEALPLAQLYGELRTALLSPTGDLEEKARSFQLQTTVPDHDCQSPYRFHST
jgi:hypothetical protein